MKKVVLHIITGLNNGGAEGVLYRVCTNDTDYRHVVISMMGAGKYGPLLKNSGIEVHYLNLNSGKLSFKALLSLFKLIRNYKPSIVQTWMYHADLIGGLIAKIAGVNFIYWNVRHTELKFNESKFSTICVAKICALLSRFVPTRIVYCAHKALKIHESIGYQVGKGEIIANGYDLSYFCPDNAKRQDFRNELKIMSHENLIGFVGRFDIQKDHFGLISALSLLKKNGYSFKLALVGCDLDNNNDLLLHHISINQLNDHVMLLGQRSDIPTVMAGLDIHVLPSSFGEAFPNVLAEAMACSTPCVVTDVGDASLIVGDTGLVVKPKDPLLLSAAISKLLDEKQNDYECWLERKQLCRNRISQNFTIDNMLKNYHHVWECE